MNALLWTLQILTALLYASSGIMKLFLLDKVSQGVPSFGALPRRAWHTLGVLELVCTALLILPGALHWHPELTATAAILLSLEGMLFLWVHLRYTEPAARILSVVLALIMAFIAYGRLVLHPLT